MTEPTQDPPGPNPTLTHDKHVISELLILRWEFLQTNRKEYISVVEG